MFKTIDEIKAANAARGDNWFSPDTLRHWRSRVGKTVYGGRYFVSSETLGEEPRRYTVRHASPDGNVGTADGCTFRQFATHAEAARHARILADRLTIARQQDSTVA